MMVPQISELGSNSAPRNAKACFPIKILKQFPIDRYSEILMANILFPAKKTHILKAVVYVCLLMLTPRFGSNLERHASCRDQSSSQIVLIRASERASTGSNQFERSNQVIRPLLLPNIQVSLPAKSQRQPASANGRQDNGYFFQVFISFSIPASLLPS